MRTTDVKMSHDGNVGHLELNGVDVSTKVSGSGLTFQSRAGQPPLLTIAIHLPAFKFDGPAEVAIDAASEDLLRAAGWVRADEVTPAVVNHYGTVVSK